MFHAAGLCDFDGSVAALIGPSGTGKSTAARTLCRENFGYVTDETVALRRDGSVVPFPKPIAVVPPDGGVKLELGPNELGLRPCPSDLQLHALVRLERDQAYVSPEVDVLQLLEGMLALVPDMSALPQLEAPLAWLAETVERCGGVHRVRYRDASQLSGPIQSALASPPVASGFRHFSGTAGTVDRRLDRPQTDAPNLGMSAEQTGEPVFSRAAFDDAVEVAGEVLILRGSLCSLLSGVGGVVWLAAAQPCSLTELASEVVNVVGPHPQAQQLVNQAVMDLEELGILTRTKLVFGVSKSVT